MIFNGLKLPQKNINEQLLCALLAGRQLFVNVFHGGFKTLKITVCRPAVVAQWGIYQALDYTI